MNREEKLLICIFNNNYVNKILIKHKIKSKLINNIMNDENNILLSDLEFEKRIRKITNQSLRDVVTNHFIWTTSKEGYEYWDNILTKIELL